MGRQEEGDKSPPLLLWLVLPAFSLERLPAAHPPRQPLSAPLPGERHRPGAALDLSGRSSHVRGWRSTLSASPARTPCCWAGASPCSPLCLTPADPRGLLVSSDLAEHRLAGPHRRRTAGGHQLAAASGELGLAALPPLLSTCSWPPFSVALSISVKILASASADGDERHLPLAHHQCRLPLHLAPLLLLPRGPCSTAWLLTFHCAAH